MQARWRAESRRSRNWSRLRTRFSSREAPKKAVAEIVSRSAAMPITTMSSISVKPARAARQAAWGRNVVALRLIRVPFLAQRQLMLRTFLKSPSEGTETS